MECENRGVVEPTTGFLLSDPILRFRALAMTPDGLVRGSFCVYQDIVTMAIPLFGMLCLRVQSVGGGK